VVGVFSGFVVDEGVTGGMDDPRLVGVFRGFGVTGGFWGLVVTEAIAGLSSNQQTMIDVPCLFGLGYRVGGIPSN
jgi:hypothetical protein